MEYSRWSLRASKRQQSAMNSNTPGIIAACGRATHHKGYLWSYVDACLERTVVGRSKVLPSYSNYEIHDDGRVYSRTSKRFLKTAIRGGYRTVGLYPEGKDKLCPQTSS